MKRIFSNKLFSWAILIVVLVSAYFVNVEVQSYWGRQALAATRLQSLPLDESIKKAAAEDKMIIVDVSAIWCPTCRKLDKTVFADPQVRKVINEKFAFTRLEYESKEGTEFLKKHKTRGFPSLFLLRPDGNVVRRLRVVFEPDQFLAQLP